MTKYMYIRVSSLDQADKGLSVQAQTDRAKELGIPEENIYIDAGRSAGIHEENIQYALKDGRYVQITIDLTDRTAFRELYGRLEKGDEVVVVKWDRLSRHMAFLDFFCQMCEKLGVTLTPLEESKERLTRRILGVVAEEELFKTASRNDAIYRSLYERGLCPYNAPLGYIKNIKTDKGLRYPELPESCLILNQEDVPRIREMYKLISEGWGAKAVCKKLSVNSTTLYSVIRNKTYLGMTHYGDEWKKTPHVPQIISQELWEKANARIKTSKSILGKSQYSP